MYRNSRNDKDVGCIGTLLFIAGSIFIAIAEGDFSYLGFIILLGLGVIILVVVLKQDDKKDNSPEINYKPIPRLNRQYSKIKKKVITPNPKKDDKVERYILGRGMVRGVIDENKFPLEFNKKSFLSVSLRFCKPINASKFLERNKNIRNLKFSGPFFLDDLDFKDRYIFNLFIDNNRPTEVIKLINAYDELKTLELSNIENIPLSFLKSKRNLRSLKISKCTFDSDDANINFNYLNSLKHLEISNIKLKSLKFLEGLEKLESLAINNCGLHEYPEICSLRNLENCELKFNNLKYINRRYFNHASLKKLDLTKNKIRTLQFPKGIINFPLQELNLTGNMIKSFSTKYFKVADLFILKENHLRKKFIKRCLKEKNKVQLDREQYQKKWESSISASNWKIIALSLYFISVPSAYYYGSFAAAIMVGFFGLIVLAQFFRED